MHFTILHWITFLILLILFVLFCVLALKQTNKKIIYSMLFSNFLVISMLGTFSVFVLDKYTKKAKLENVIQKRILITESLTLSGKIRNVGSFDIGTCNLEVKLVSNAITNSSLSGSNVFNPRSGLGSLFRNDKEEKPTTVIRDFIIAKNLKKGELRNFSISMRYPPYFKKPFINYKLYCH
jgi:hypothetical protein